MNIFVFIPAFLIFIYCLYKLVKDDYIFIRKNISSEQMLDIAFIITWISLFFSRLLFFILSFRSDTNIFLSFFSLQANDFSLLGLVLGGVGGLYLFGKYRKLPISRLIYFFTTAFAVALPIGFFISMFSFKEYELLLYFINGVIYAIFAYNFIKYLNSKPTIFLLFFSSISLISSLLLHFLRKTSFITVENILLLLLMAISLVLFFKQK